MSKVSEIPIRNQIGMMMVMNMVRVPVGGVEIFPPPIDEDIPVVYVDVEGAAVDDADADLDFVEEGIFDEIPETPREKLYRESFLNLSRPTDPQSYLYCHTSSFELMWNVYV
ncbi:hypothetical protein JTB14_035089 [Gonioctena quinquepunctata]|nr:hypothetical protein JTB14_035089 [Gonioctena quinquepunctata]